MGIYLVMKNNFNKNRKNKLSFFVSFFLPVILCLVAGSIEFKNPSVRIGILYGDNNRMKAEVGEVFHLLNSSEGLKAAIADEDTLNTDLITGRFHAVMDYRESSSVESFHLLSNQDENRMEVLEGSIKEAVRNRKAISFGGYTKEKLSSAEQSMAIILTIFLVISTVHAVGIISDKQSGTFTRYRFSGQKAGSYVVGYLLYNFVLTLTGVVLSILLLSVVKELSISVIGGIMIAFAIASLSTMLSTVITLGSKSELQANVMASSFAALASILGGTFVAIEHMPKLLQILSFASPVRWIIELTKFF